MNVNRSSNAANMMNVEYNQFFNIKDGMRHLLFPTVGKTKHVFVGAFFIYQFCMSVKFLQIIQFNTIKQKIYTQELFLNSANMYNELYVSHGSYMGAAQYGSVYGSKLKYFEFIRYANETLYFVVHFSITCAT